MVRKTIDHHGGKISIESAPGKGTCISFTWPKWDGDLTLPEI